MSGRGLEMWTIYRRPVDLPQYAFVARMHVVDDAGTRATSAVLVADQLDSLRAEFSGRGLVCLTRSPGDEPHIIETWF
jgi:hypothetical protein